MKKIILITISVFIFIFVTISVLSSDTRMIKRVKIVNSAINIKNSSTETEINKTEINTASVKTETATSKTQNNEEKISYGTKQYKSQSSYDTYTSKPEYNNSQSTFYSQEMERYNSQKNYLENRKKRDIENSDQRFKQQFEEFQRQNNSQRQPDRYGYKDIDWNTWKSNFVNKILEDSVVVTVLDEYEVGSWFYYSFNVTNTGEIQNIKITSPSLSPEDKQIVKDFIKSYEHTNLTVFPKNTSKQRVNVKALMLLGEKEKKSKPSDFNDNERIKFKY